MSIDDVKVSFDDKYRIRVLNVDKFQHTEELGDACSAFVGKNQEFGTLISGIVEVLDANAQRIELEKLRAIGMRNRVTAECENRDQARRALLALIAEKSAELDRASKQHQSLVQVEAEQKLLIEKLGNSEA
ncbi:intraflagellar transport protein 20 [Pelagophyceae sp. CCMP2097]|nr:intraflagellar transport protein 20 [Pelagophyceae sp. CCMP2097]